MTIESTLKEVEPLLQGRIPQFTHPSFQEVLAAKQFAGEINSGRLDVQRAAFAFWIDDPIFEVPHVEDVSSFEYLPDPECLAPMHISYKWRPVLVRMAPVLNENKANKVIDVIANIHKRYIPRGSSYNVEEIDHEILEDLVTCTEYIRLHQHHSNPAEEAKGVLDALVAVFYDYAVLGHEQDDLPMLEQRAKKAISALARTRSAYVLNILNEFTQNNKYVHACDSSDQLFFSCNDAHRAIEQIEDDRINDCLSIESEGVSILEHLMSRLSSSTLHGADVEKFFWKAFRLIWKLDFSPRLVRLFNEKIANLKDCRLMDGYHRSLNFLARKLHEEHDVNLYEYLRKKKIQFWDFDLVYKPK